VRRSTWNMTGAPTNLIELHRAPSLGPLGPFLVLAGKARGGKVPDSEAFPTRPRGFNPLTFGSVVPQIAARPLETGRKLPLKAVGDLERLAKLAKPAARTCWGIA
jgi:hypothetical protein